MGHETDPDKLTPSDLPMGEDSQSTAVKNNATPAPVELGQVDGSCDGHKAGEPIQDRAHKIGIDRHDRDEIRRIFEKGEFPYKRKISRKSYEKKKAELQTELLKAQDWVKETNQKIVLLFEGRDAAGKGGTIKRFIEHLNPRGARVVALDKPTRREQTQWFFQRYIEHLALWW